MEKGEGTCGRRVRETEIEESEKVRCREKRRGRRERDILSDRQTYREDERERGRANERKKMRGR